MLTMRLDPGLELQDDQHVQRHQRQHRAAAADAALLLIHDALIQIRAMAYSRKTVAAPEATGGDYHERIRMIADVCENLPGYLRTGTAASSAQGLQSAWDNADETQRAWLRDTLTQHGIDIAGLVAT
jgi:hypothetical protein